MADYICESWLSFVDAISLLERLRECLFPKTGRHILEIFRLSSVLLKLFASLYISLTPLKIFPVVGQEMLKESQIWSQH